MDKIQNRHGSCEPPGDDRNLNADCMGMCTEEAGFHREGVDEESYGRNDN